MQNAHDQEFIDAYDEFADALYRHCYFRVFSKERAEELVQETFMKAWQYVAKGNDVENMRAFLYRIANNLVIDYSRKKKEESLDALLAISPTYEPSVDGRKETERNLMIDHLHKVMQELPDDVRQILLLRYVEDLDPKEIALVLDITSNNVSVRLNRAHASLKQLIDNLDSAI
jgi:RNA polymerase sigma-70 factor (ECF subfamily)